MSGLTVHETFFIVTAFTFQVILIIHFALRRWRFEQAMRFGPFVYALSIPAAVLSLFQLLSGESWFLWVGGFIYLTWAVYGYSVEYIWKIEWRNSLNWPILGPYIILYLATVMLFWWPLASIYKPLWYGCTALFIISTYLNVTSHKKSNLILTESKS